MASFHWRQIPEDPLERYNNEVLGRGAWQQLLRALFEVLRAEEPDPLLAAFDKFLGELRQIEKRPSVCRIFVSHQRGDVVLAERIAYLADQRGFEYWLDVHDPLLQYVSHSKLLPVVQSILIAAIIKLALLNC